MFGFRVSSSKIQGIKKVNSFFKFRSLLHYAWPIFVFQSSKALWWLSRVPRSEWRRESRLYDLGTHILVRTGHKGVQQFRLGFSGGNIFPPGRRVRLSQRRSDRIAWFGEGRSMVRLPCWDSAFGPIACEEYDTACHALRQRSLENIFRPETELPLSVAISVLCVRCAPVCADPKGDVTAFHGLTLTYVLSPLIHVWQLHRW
jgi:hypothetical protein